MSTINADMHSLKVNHDGAKQRFYFDLADGDCYIDYVLLSGGVYDLRHTWTSPERRGQGLAAVLTEQVCEWLLAESAKIVPSCPYIADFVQRCPRYQELLAVLGE